MSSLDNIILNRFFFGNKSHKKVAVSLLINLKMPIIPISWKSYDKFYLVCNFMNCFCLFWIMMIYVLVFWFFGFVLFVYFIFGVWRMTAAMCWQLLPQSRHWLVIAVGYTMRDIRYKWNEGPNSVGVSHEVSLPQFKVLGHRQRAMEISLTTGIHPPRIRYDTIRPGPIW